MADCPGANMLREGNDADGFKADLTAVIEPNHNRVSYLDVDAAPSSAAPSVFLALRFSFFFAALLFADAAAAVAAAETGR